MKLAELRSLTSDELRARIETLLKELFEARFKLATHQLEDTALFRRKRREIAQLETLVRQKQQPALKKPSQGEQKIHA